MPHPSINRHHFDIRRTARFYTIGNADETVTDLWIVLHGYGQLAAEFAQPFVHCAREGRLIVVPEGLSRFYRSNSERIMGASWMTAEDRKMEIRDYVQYLNALYRHVIETGVPEGVRLSILGFSQGTATATRWLADGQVTADRLILWGGNPAFELCTEEFQIKVPVEQIQLVTGTKDKYLSPDRHTELRPTISKNGNEVDCLVFEGPHAIDVEMLSRLME